MLATTIFALSTMGSAQTGKLNLKDLTPIPIKVQTRFTKLPARKPSAQAKLDAAAVKLLHIGVDMKPTEDLGAKVRQEAVSPFSGQISPGNSSDVEALCFIVLMQATKDMDEDLKQIMDSVKEINKEKENLRKQHEDIERLGSKFDKQLGRISFGCKVILGPFEYKPTKHKLGKLPDIGQSSSLPKNIGNMSFNDLRSQYDKNKVSLDSLGELSEELELRLQTLMDRRSKFIDALSNIMKKISDTASSIISNLK